MLNGGSGADAMTGGAGYDTYFVDNTGDTVTELLQGGGDLVQSTISYTLPTQVEDLTLLGGANLNGTGNTLANAITGNSGNNALSGGDGLDKLDGAAGNDRLDGGAGSDALTGGLGGDKFVFHATGNGNDIITDFSGQTAFGGGAGQGDKLVLEHLLHGAFAYRGGNPFTHTGNTEAQVHGARVDVDVDGNGAADFNVFLTGLTNPNQLVAGDFLVTP